MKMKGNPLKTNLFVKIEPEIIIDRIDEQYKVSIIKSAKQMPLDGTI